MCEREDSNFRKQDRDLPDQIEGEHPPVLGRPDGIDDGRVAGPAVHADADPLGRAFDVTEGTSSEGQPTVVRTQRRRVRLPLILFLVTCLSTFWVGANGWLPFPATLPSRQTLIAHWQDGLIYMVCVLAILLTHEMGHFVATLRYRIPASLPFFVPFPIAPIGTMGAVIGMDGHRADRREIFDIGLAGPVAGLFVAIPITWIGILKLDMTQPSYGVIGFDLPLAVRLALDVLRPPGYESGQVIWISQWNPYFIAGLVGLFITGLNMLPVSQLDGGHVMYSLLLKRSRWVARGIVVLAVLDVLVRGQWHWSLMVLLVLLIGVSHPPTRDDSRPLGWFRVALGVFALLIPVFCFSPRLIVLG